MISEDALPTLNRMYAELEAPVEITYQFDPRDGKTFQQFNDHLLNFRVAMERPVHRWFEYKEGFSPDLIRELLARLRVDPTKLVLDPFCGGGTLPVTCFYAGRPAAGFETNPFSWFLSRVKTRRYDRAFLADARRAKDEVLATATATRGGRAPDHAATFHALEFSMVDRLFEPPVLKVLANLAHAIDAITPGDATPPGDAGQGKVRDFLKLAWLAVLEPASNYRKAGNGLKRKRSKAHARWRARAPGDLEAWTVAAFTRQLDRMLVDVAEYCIPRAPVEPDPGEPAIWRDSCKALDARVADGSVGATIFSPPYLNCFDYCEIYKIELWLGGFVTDYAHLRDVRGTSIISHMNHAGVRAEVGSGALASPVTPVLEEFLAPIDPAQLWHKRIPAMIHGYFHDMDALLARLHAAHAPDSHVVIVVSNSAYGGVVIPTDVLLGRIGEAHGFKLARVEAVRPIVTSSQQFNFLREHALTRYMRESLVYLHKPNT